MGIDVYESAIWIRVSDGRIATVPLSSHSCVADIWSGFRDTLANLDLVLDIWEKPQEIADTTPFSEDRRDCTIVANDAQRFCQVLASINAIFEEFRSRFFGRSGVQFWWGSFDFTVLLFTGKHEKAPDNRGYIMRYDLDAEHMNAGFWPGDDNNPHPVFYAYLVPKPEGCETVPVGPEYAGWVEAMGEWVMPYEAARTSSDPRKAILAFLDSVYGVAITLGRWDAERFTYQKPLCAHRGRGGSPA